MRLAPGLFAIALCAAQAPSVDSFIREHARRNGVVLPAPVGDAAFARRAYLDTWGLLPSPSQVAEFTADRRPGKRARLVDALLANRRHYSEHWITFWNDLLRNDEGVVYHGTRQSITDWLLSALEQNIPYDRFVTALLNPVAKTDPHGFLTGVNWRGDVSASMVPAMQAAQNSAQVFLGVNLKCNSCHDSFISKWKLKDAYGLASFFAETPLEIHRCDAPTGEKAEPKFLYPELGGIAATATAEEKRTAAARLFTARENRRFARTLVNRIWHRLMGRGLVATVDDMDRHAFDPALLDWLADDFIEHGYDLQHLLRRILTSRAYALPAVSQAPKTGEAYVFRGPLPRRFTAEQFVDAIASVTGEWRATRGAYTRDWRMKSTLLTRALGRPIRDQVYTERNSEATTLQALEVVNGETLHTLIERGAQRLLGKLPEPPAPLYDSGVVSQNPGTIDIDVGGAKRLWLLLENADSYDAARTVAGWAEPRLDETPLAPQPPAAPATLQFRKHSPVPGLAAPLGTTLVYDTGGARRFRATAGVDESCLKSDISPRVRFFVFDREPDRHQLARVTGEPPVPRAAAPATTDYLLRYALGRAATPAERQIARRARLEDLLWSLFLSPEFQYIQ